MVEVLCIYLGNFTGALNEITEMKHPPRKYCDINEPRLNDTIYVEVKNSACEKQIERL